MRGRRRTLGLVVAVALLAGAGVALATRPNGSTSAPAVAARPLKRVVVRHRTPLRRVAAAPRSAPTLHLPGRLPTRQVAVPILMYHRIDRVTPDMPSVTRGLTVTPADFAGQIAWISAHGYHTITQLQLWNALIHGRPLPARPVLITFDDAYRDVVTYAAPVLARYHEHATAYVITDRLSHGRVTPWMTWPQLRLLERDGFDIGSHTVSHVDLVAVGPTEARLQLRASRFALERYLHEPVQWLAYPYGKVDATVEQLARKAGYVLAVTTTAGTRQPADAPLLLHRQEVGGSLGVAGLAALLSASSG